MLRHIPAAAVLIIGLLSVNIKCEEFLECFNEEIGTLIPAADNCSKAIYCNGIQSAIVDCGAQNPYFSAKDKLCSDDITVCNERFSPEVTTTTITSLPTPTAATSRPTLITATSKPTPPIFSTTTMVTSTVTSTPKVESTTDFTTTSSAYFSSSRPTPTVLSTIAVDYTTTTTTRKPSTTLVVSTAQVITTAAPSINGLSCPLQDDPRRPVYLPHPQSCTQYYLCYHGTPIVMQCPNMLLFDVIQQSCNAAELVHCQFSSISTPPRQCLPHMVTVYPHPKNCNYYYRCEYGYLKVMQCPFGMGWDYEMAICTRLSQTKCYKSSQRNVV